MRALSVEIEQAAERFARGLGTNLTVGIRTGDTSQKERAAQKKSMPDLLITTPESLQLLLSSKNYDKTFENLEKHWKSEENLRSTKQNPTTNEEHSHVFALATVLTFIALVSYFVITKV